MSKEKREYSRVNTRLKGLAEKVSDPNILPAFHSSSLNTTGKSKYLQESNLPEELKKFLESLDQKLERILSIQSQDILEKEYPLRTEIVELSGAGLKCLQTEPCLQVNDYIEIVLILSYQPVSMASAIGLVQRLENAQNSEYAVVEFVSMRESEREAIVQFVFQEQREQIRFNKYE